MGDLAVVVVQNLGPKGFPLALLKVTIIAADMPRLAAAQAGHKEGGKELGKCTENIKWEGVRGVAISLREDRFETIPEILASRASGDQARDAKVQQIPKMTCLVEVLEERETTVLGEEIHEIPGDGGQAVKGSCTRCCSCRSRRGCRCLSGIRVPVREKGLRKEGMQLRGMPPCLGHGLSWTSGGGPRGELCQGPAQSSACKAAA